MTDSKLQKTPNSESPFPLYSSNLPSTLNRKDFISPELAYNHEKRKLFSKIGYEGYSRNKELSSRQQNLKEVDISQPLNSSTSKIKDRSFNAVTFKRKQQKANSSFYENRLTNLLKARNKTQDRKDTGSTIFTSNNAQRRMSRMHPSHKKYSCKGEQHQFGVLENSIAQQSNASLINESTNMEISYYCNEDLEKQQVQLRRAMKNNLNTNIEPCDLNRNSSTRGSQQSSLMAINQSGYSSIKQIARHSTTVVPSMRGNQRQNQVLYSLVPEIKGIQPNFIMELYEAKCLDLKINPSKNQMLRFFEMIKKNCSKQGTRLNLVDMGFGDNSLKVISKIIKHNNNFAILDLRKNFVTGSGISLLAQALLQNDRIVHLDLGCNQINSESAEELFTLLQRQKSITSISLANQDCYKYKNKLGNKGAQALGMLLAKNHMISMIDLTNNALSTEGIQYLMEGVKRNPNIISLNLSQNDIGSGLHTFQSVLSIFKSTKDQPSLAKCPLLEELVLSQNHLTNKNMDELTEVFNNCPRIGLKRLDLSNNKFSSKGVVSLIQTLKNNPQIKLTHLNLEKSNLDQGTIQESVNNHKILTRLIFEYLRTNKYLQYLNLSYCYINNDIMTSIGKALLTNEVLTSLILRANKVDHDGIKDFCIACTDNKNLKLRVFDLSSNKLNDESGVKLAQAIKHLKNIQQLSLRDNSFGVESSDAFLFLVKEKPNLWRCQLDLNLMKYMTLLEIEKTCKKNKRAFEKDKIPTIKQEINDLSKKVNPNVRIDVLDKKVKEQQKQIEIGFKHVRHEEEIVHDIINHGDEELRELEEIKMQLEDEKRGLDDIIEGIDDRTYEKKRELERKVADEMYVIEKCQDHNERLEKRIKTLQQRCDERRNLKGKCTEESKLRKDLEVVKREEKMLSLIIENYEKEIEKKIKPQDESQKQTKDVTQVESQNALQSMLNVEKGFFRGSIVSDSKGEQIQGISEKEGGKEKQKKSKTRSGKKHGEKQVKGLLHQLYQQQAQMSVVKQK